MSHQRPRSLSFDIVIRQVSCGDFHSAFITEQGQTFAIGRNNVGQLGVGDKSLKLSTCPLLVQAINEFALKVKSGGNQSVVVT